MRARSCLTLVAAWLLAPAPVGAAAEPLRLETPTKVDAIKLADVDGDRIPDVVTLSGRTVCVWTAGKAGGLTPAPQWRVDLPEDVSFVDVSRGRQQPALLCLGKANAFHLTLEGAGARTPEPVPLSGPLGWGSAKAVFADLYVREEGGGLFVVPGAQGWRLVGGEGYGIRSELLGLERREVVPAGSFLEDVTTVTTQVPPLFSEQDVRPGAGTSVPIFILWGLVGDRLVCWTSQADKLEFDASFLPAAGDRRLLRLDQDTLPDVVHRERDNRESKYAFFRVPGPRAEAGAWVTPDLRPPAAFLRLSGFNIDPDYGDVNGDGLLDFVVTTIAVDGPNTIRAIASGKVTATTLAFLQRKPAPGASMFPTQPDATVTSDIGVRLRFSYTGTIDVTRSFTILATGDLDGDGRKDLVIRSSPTALQVRKGTADGVWAKEAVAVAIPAVGPGEECEPTAANLDGKPGDEVLLLYRGAENAPDRLYVLKP